MPVIVLQCSEKKAKGNQPAAFKYDTRAHRVVLDFMWNGGWACGWTMMLLSAEHGLVECTTPVADYDCVLTPRTVAPFVATHGDRARKTIDTHGDATTILFYGSKLYQGALETMLPHRKVRKIGEGGRGCGDHFSALKAGLAKYSEDA